MAGMASGNGKWWACVETVVNFLLPEDAGISWLDEESLVT